MLRPVCDVWAQHLKLAKYLFKNEIFQNAAKITCNLCPL